MDRWAIVTGANAGMGKVITLALAKAGIPVVMACRSMERSAEVREEIIRESGNNRLELIPLDLASFASIHDFVRQLGEREIRVLVNNAGVMCREYAVTPNGLEMTVGVNYVGTWLLTYLLLPFMGKNGSSRIINTTSCTSRFGRVDGEFFRLNPRGYRRFRAYPNSKLAVLLFTVELARRLQGQAITVNAVDPGVVNTGMITMDQWFDPLANLFFRPFIKSPEKGAETAILLAASEEYARVSGGLFRDRKRVRVSRHASDECAGRALWERTELWVAGKEKFE